LVERFVYTEDVGGSSPSSPTSRQACPGLNIPSPRHSKRHRISIFRNLIAGWLRCENAENLIGIRGTARMKSSAGAHYPALDHVRCLAAFLVFSWHFLHGYPDPTIPLAFTPAVFPLSVMDEGHTGVSLFMALSGYLFAKLLEGRSVRYLPFLFNRALRLLPLLLVVVLMEGVRIYANNESMADYLDKLSLSFLLPSLPNGGWSITIETHFYLVLPLLLLASSRFSVALLLFIAAAVLARASIYMQSGEVQWVAYRTIIGHADQFLAGIFAFRVRDYAKGRHWLAFVILAAFSGFYWWFDAMGGFYRLQGHPSQNWLWIILPTIEAAAYSFAIAYYDTNFSGKSSNIFLWIVEKGGSYSYSIYLLHVFFVFKMATFIGNYIMDISNFYVACLWSAISFLFMIPVGYLSYRCIEAPFLRLRVPYTGDASANADRRPVLASQNAC
jgi:peptidoglycan/LPS O-acetylase OafA/YrhL